MNGRRLRAYWDLPCKAIIPNYFGDDVLTAYNYGKKILKANIIQKKLSCKEQFNEEAFMIYTDLRRTMAIKPEEQAILQKPITLLNKKIIHKQPQFIEEDLFCK